MSSGALAVDAMKPTESFLTIVLFGLDEISGLADHPDSMNESADGGWYDRG